MSLPAVPCRWLCPHVSSEWAGGVRGHGRRRLDRVRSGRVLVKNLWMFKRGNFFFTRRIFILCKILISHFLMFCIGPDSLVPRRRRPGVSLRTCFLTETEIASRGEGGLGQEGDSRSGPVVAPGHEPEPPGTVHRRIHIHVCGPVTVLSDGSSGTTPGPRQRYTYFTNPLTVSTHP